MLSEKDIEVLVKKYGELWVLRDLDFFPEKLSQMSRVYPYGLMVWCKATEEDSKFVVFKDELEAYKKSIEIYMNVLKRKVPISLYERYWELTQSE